MPPVAEQIQEGIFVEYQPIISLVNRQPVSYEVLARWCLDGLIVMPDDFIPVAAATGQLEDVTAAVIDLSGDDFSQAQLELDRFVNLSVLQITDDDWLQTQLESADPKIVWEITETEDADINRLATAVADIRHAGIKVALDDFGSGAAGLNRLASAEWDFIKVDRSLVDQVSESRRHRLCVQAIIDLAYEMGTAVICEGIETEEQSRTVLDMGCGLGQGWLFGKPAPIGAWL